MNLLVDFGNTRLKWCHGGPDGERGAVSMEDDWSGTLRRNWHDLPKPERVICVSVQTATAEKKLGDLVSRLWGIHPELVPAMVSCCGVSNGYTQPDRLGRDRLIAMIGARAVTTSPTLVVDCGTAVTIDLLDGSGHHRGGWILPGLSLMRTTLLERTASLPQSICAPASAKGLCFGLDTAPGIIEGARAAVSGAVLRALNLGTELVGVPPDCLITGGDGKIVASALAGHCLHVPELVFTGLARYADETFSE